MPEILRICSISVHENKITQPHNKRNIRMKLTTLFLLALISSNLSAAGKSAFISTKVLLDKSPQAVEANKVLQQEVGARE